MEKQSTRKFLKLLIALVALFLLAASALMLASCKEHVHQYELDQDKSTNATCNQAGSQTFVCPECGDIYVNVVPATGQHTWQETKVYPASCESEGWTVFTCSVCGTQKQDNWTPKLTHDYDVAETHEATCTTDGYQIFECTFCGDRYTDSQYTAEHPALGHQFAANTDAEDTLEGVDPSDFGYATVEAMKADGWTTVSVANCTTNGVIERKCTREGCDYVDSKIGAQATGHKWNGTAVTATTKDVCKIDPDLVDVDGNAIYAYECENENCPVNVVIDSRGTEKHYIKAVEHTYKASTDAADGYVAATCENPGTDVQKCEVCGDIQKTETEKLGHSWNTLRIDGKTEVVVCEKDKDLTRNAYLDAMKGYLGVEEYAKVAGILAQNYKDNTDYSCFCTRCGELHEATGHEYVVAKLQDGKYGLNDYEKNEDGTPVEAEGVTVATMDCRYVQVCKNGCGKVLGKGQHGNVVAATCRAGGYCETCGEQVTAQLDHDYKDVATIIGYKDSANKDEKALYDAYIKVSATESWMQPVKGSCETASTTVQVCTKCLLDAANGAEFTWSVSDKELTTSDPAYSASVVESDATHNWQAHYYRLNATSLESGEIVKEQTNCEFGFKLVYKCADCGKVYINTIVGDNEKTEADEAKDNTFGEKGVTDANGFIIDVSKYATSTDDDAALKALDEKEVADLKVAENKGVHALYAVKNYDETNGYVAPNCTTVAQIPFYCTKCGATFVMDANKTAEAGKWAYATADDYKAADLVASECVTEITGDDAKVDLTNHAGATFACDDHCKVTDTNGNYICGQLVADYNASTDPAGSATFVAKGDKFVTDAAHATVNVEYRLSVDVKYYTGYSLKVAYVPDSAIDEKTNEIDFSKATLADTTKVSVCHNGSKYDMPEVVKDSGNEYGDYLVLVAEDGTVYGLKAFKLYTEDGDKSDLKPVSDKTVVNQDDIFFVVFTEGTTATDAPVAAVNGTSLGMAFGGVAETVGTGNTAKKVLTVNVAQDITLEPTESLEGIIDATSGVTVADEYVVDLNGHKITQSAATQLATSKNLTFTDGTIEFTATGVGASSSMINPEGDASLTLDGVTLTTKSGTAIYAEDTNEGTRAYPTIVINDSTITSAGGYGISTNAKNAVPDADWEKFSITITDSKISAGSKDVPGTALFINVPSDVTVEGSELTANYQVVVVRGGTLNMTNTKLTLLDTYKDAEVKADDPETADINENNFKDVLNSGNGFNANETEVGNFKDAIAGITDVQTYRLAGVWDQGNGIARGAIVVGNSNGSASAYQNVSYVKMNGITFDIANKNMPKLVVASYYNAATMGAGTEASPYKTMVTVDATGMGLDATEITYCFNAVMDTIKTIGFVNAD